jgi:hypothetical protein
MRKILKRQVHWSNTGARFSFQNGNTLISPVTLDLDVHHARRVPFLLRDRVNLPLPRFIFQAESQRATNPALQHYQSAASYPSAVDQ